MNSVIYRVARAVMVRLTLEKEVENKRIAWPLVKSGVKLAWTLVSWPFIRKVSVVVYRDRMNRGCHLCPIFDMTFGTCGGPGSIHEGKLIGCGCLMELKAQLPESRCWLEEKGLKSGWPME